MTKTCPVCKQDYGPDYSRWKNRAEEEFKRKKVCSRACWIKHCKRRGSAGLGGKLVPDSPDNGFELFEELWDVPTFIEWQGLL